MFESLFGADTPLAIQFFIAFVIVLLLIGATFWLIRRFGADRLNAATTRGRQPRLSVIDAAAIDGRRRLVLVRRDNVEHLIMIGGPSDLVVESNIVRAVPVTPPRELHARNAAQAEARAPDARPPEAMPPRPPGAPSAAVLADGSRPVPEPNLRPNEPPRRAPEARPAEPYLAPSPAGEDKPWPPQPGRPRQEEPIRPPRSDPRTPPMPVEARVTRAVEPRAEPVRPEPPRAEAPWTGNDPSGPPGAPPFRMETPPEARWTGTPEVAHAPPTADADLADMAQRLEAALRRPFAAGNPEAAHAPAPKPDLPKPDLPKFEPVPPELPKAETLKPESFRPSPPPRRRPWRPRLLPEPPASPPAAHALPEPPRSSAPEPRPEPKPKTVFDSLEEEMANLLGRPKSKE